MCPSFSLCACRILKMRSCLRSPLAPGSSKDRAILVSSVIFFSLSSAMVIFTYVDFSFSGGIVFFSRGDGLLCRRAGTRRSRFKQLAVVLRQSSRVRLGCHDVPHRRSCQIPDSWFPECGCSAYGTCALPSRQAGRAYTGSAKYVARQIHDQSAFSFVLFHLGIIRATIHPSFGCWHIR